MTNYLNRGYFICGLRAIGKFCGMSPSTIRNWIDRQAFPACKMPNGQWGTTAGMIDAWVLARQNVLEEKKKKKSTG